MKFPLSDLHIDPTLCPAKDELFMSRMMDVMKDRLGLYFAAVPLSLCIPFDQDYRPDLHKIGAPAIKQAAEVARAGNHPNMISYQRGYWFVISDDYIPYFAALTGLPDYVPCFILGEPEHPLIRDVQGPLENAGRYLGF